MRTVAALYVDPRGPYPSMPGVECWDEARDARLYDGPHPVVAHPPCGPWGSLFRLCRKQDASAGPAAVEAVRRFGGVLEHPENSKLFRAVPLPGPGELPDHLGGRTYLVDQVSWGHACRKRTWLYVVGVPARIVESWRRSGGIPTHVIAVDRRKRTRPDLKEASAEIRRRTPQLFAEWLVSLARASSVRVEERSA